MVRVKLVNSDAFQNRIERRLHVVTQPTRHVSNEVDRAVWGDPKEGVPVVGFPEREESKTRFEKPLLFAHRAERIQIKSSAGKGLPGT